MQLGGDCPLPHNLTEDATNDRDPSVVSFTRTLIFCAVLYSPVLLSFTATSAIGDPIVAVSEAEAHDVEGVSGLHEPPI